MSQEWFPLEHSEKYKISLEPLKDEPCVCGHKGIQHMSQGNRTCTTADCNCVAYKRYEPKFDSTEDFEEKAMKYFQQTESQLENVRWVYENLIFFRNYNDLEIGWAWGKYVLGYDPFETFMTPDIYKKIQRYGSHSAIERLGRRLREECKKSHKGCTEKSHENCTHECKYCPYDPDLLDNKIVKSYGIYSFFRDNQIK